jgi:hypothetical protein
MDAKYPFGGCLTEPEYRPMQSPSASPQRESWRRCRRSLASRLAQEPLFAIAVQTIDWAVAQGIADRTYASLSLDRLVISDAEPRTEGASMLVLIPKPNSMELRLYRDAGLAERVEIDHSHLCEQLARLVSQFYRASNP